MTVKIFEMIALVTINYINFNIKIKPQYVFVVYYTVINSAYPLI